MMTNAIFILLLLLLKIFYEYDIFWRSLFWQCLCGVVITNNSKKTPLRYWCSYLEAQCPQNDIKNKFCYIVCAKNDIAKQILWQDEIFKSVSEPMKTNNYLSLVSTIWVIFIHNFMLHCTSSDCIIFDGHFLFSI